MIKMGALPSAVSLGQNDTSEEGTVTLAHWYRLCPMLMLPSQFSCFWTLGIGWFPWLSLHLLCHCRIIVLITNVIPGSVLGVWDTQNPCSKELLGRNRKIKFDNYNLASWDSSSALNRINTLYPVSPLYIAVKPEHNEWSTEQSQN